MDVCDRAFHHRTGQCQLGFWIRKAGNIVLIAMLGLSLAACYFDDGSSSSDSNSGGGGNGQAAGVSGVAQKGPFQPGGNVSAVALAADGSIDGSAATATIGDNGSFDLPDIDWRGATQLAVSGPYFSEITGTFTGSVELHGAASLPEDANTNVNLFTHFVAARAQHLMAASMAFSEARDQARDELAAIIGIDAAPNSLNLRQVIGSSEHQDDSANLILFSAATLSANLDQADIDDMAADFANDGQINGTGQGALGQVQQAVIDHPDLLATARTHLENQYSVTPPDDTDGVSPAWALAFSADPEAIFTTSGSLHVDEIQSFDAAGSTGDGLSYAWDFGNGDTATGAQTTHVFTNEGSYTVTLTVTDGDDRTDAASQSLTITDVSVPPAPPEAAFTVSGARTTGSNLAFNASSSTGANLSYAWAFGDGGTATGAQASHAFTNADDYTVTLTVTDDDNRTDNTSQTLTITQDTVPPSPPEADFTVSGNLVTGSDLAFNASSSTGVGLNYAWDFGNGDTATGAQTTYAFASADDYTVTLTVTDSANQDDTTTQTLTITPPGPQAAFTFSGPARAGQSQHFDASDSTGDDLTYYWDFGDGDAGRNGQIAHVYDSGDSYTVTLTVTDANDSSDSASQSLTIAAAPQPVADDGIIEGLIVDTKQDLIEGVQVSLINDQDLVGGDRDASSDAEGEISLDNMPTGVEFVLKLTKNGYADRFVRTTIPAGASDAAVFAATMTERESAQMLNNAENGGNITGTDGTAITLPADALVDTSGNPVSGNVQVSLTPVDVSDADARDAFPGSFAAADENGNNGLLLSFGVAEYHLTQGGERLQLAPGKQATLTVPVYIDQYSDGSPVTAGDHIPLWSLDETTGQWVQEGTGTVVADSNSPTGLGFEMIVGHLSWYNCDDFRALYRLILHCEIAPGSGLAALEDDETCTIIARTAGSGPYSSTFTNIRGDNSSPVLAAADVDYQLVAAARNGTITGQATVRGAIGETKNVTIVLDAGVGNGEAITLPYDKESIIGAVDEPDLYRFTGQAGQFIGVQAGQAPSGSSLRGELHLTTASGQTVDTIISSGLFNSSRNGVLVAKLPADGEYLIEAEATSGAPGDYWLTASAVSSVDIDENIEGTLDRGRSSLLRTFDGTADSVVATTNVTDSSFTFSVTDTDGNTVFRKSSSGSGNGRGHLPADGTYILKMTSRSGLPAPYKTAVANIELPQPLAFDSAGRATATGDFQVYGDYQFYGFTAARDDGIFVRLETDGSDSVQPATVFLITPDEDDAWFEQLTWDYASASQHDVLVGYGASVLPVLDSIGAKLRGNSQGQTYLLAVHTEEAQPGNELGGYRLRLDRVEAGSEITVDDDLAECPGADGHSVRAAAYAIESGGIIDVCAGRYAEQFPINNGSQASFTITGRGQAGVVLVSENDSPIVNSVGERVSLESLTLVGDNASGGAGLARGVGIENVTVRASTGASADSLDALHLASGATVDGLDMDAGKVALIAEGDDISVRNSTFSGAAGRIEWEGDNAVFENNLVEAAGDDADGRYYQLSIKGTGAQVIDNTFTITGDQNTSRPTIEIVNQGKESTGGASAAPAIVRGNQLVTSSGGLAVTDFDITVEKNFVDLTDEDGGKVFSLNAPRNVRTGDVIDAVKALVRNNVFDGLSNSSASSRPLHAPIRITAPYLFTDLDIINNTIRVTPDSDDPEETGRKNRIILGITLDLGYGDTAPNEALPVRVINNIFSGWHRDDVRVGDEFTKAISVPEDFSIDANNNLFANIDVRYVLDGSDAGGSRTGGSDINGSPGFINGLLEVNDTAIGIDNGQGPMAGGPPIPDVDYGGNARPQHGSYDIGAHENVF